MSPMSLTEEIEKPIREATKPFRRIEESDQSCRSCPQVTLSSGGAIRATYSRVYACNRQLETSLAWANSCHCSCCNHSSRNHSHVVYACWSTAFSSRNLRTVTVGFVLHLCLVPLVHEVDALAKNDAADRPRHGLCINRWYVHACVFIGSAIQRWHSVLGADLGSSCSWNGIENHMEGKTYWPCDVHHHWLGSINYFAVGLWSSRFHQPVDVCPGWRCVHRWCGVVLSSKAKAVATHFRLSRNLACVYRHCWCAAIYWCGFVGRSSRVNTWHQYLNYMI